MSSAKLLNDGKTALCEELRRLEAASRQWRKCLTVEIAGIGRLDPHAVRSAEEEFESALEQVREVTAEEIAPSGLFEAAAR